MLKQFGRIRAINYQFIEFVNTQLTSEHVYNDYERDTFNKLEEHLTNMNLIFARMEDGFNNKKG